MARGAPAAIAPLKRVARAPFARLAGEERAQELLGRLQRARTALSPGQWRELVDGQALDVVLASVLRSDSSAIDIGANEGAVLRAIMRVAPHGRHMAFEPIPALFERLEEAFPYVDVRRLALSDRAEDTSFSFVVDAPAFSGLRRRQDLPAGVERVEQIAVRTERLDDLLPEGFVPALIKIDVEGAELHVMRGAAQTLERHRPAVVFEHGVGGADLYGSSSGDVFDLLAGAHLRIFDLEGHGPFSREEFVALFDQPVWNYLAVPA